MSDQKPTRPAQTDIPGLAYFTPERAKPAKAAEPTTKGDMAVLDQMYGYFAA